MKRTYWLYYKGEPIGSVLMEEGATPYDVKKKAMLDEIRCPLHEADWPHKVRQSVVRTFD